MAFTAPQKNKKIYFKPYKRKNGELMLYINQYDFYLKQQVSLGISESIHTTQLTKGQYTLYCAWDEALRFATPLIKDFVPLTQEHNKRLKEPCVSLDGGSLLMLITDIALIYGVPVGEDGLYFLTRGNLYNTYCLKRELERIVNENL